MIESLRTRLPEDDRGVVRHGHHARPGEYSLVLLRLFTRSRTCSPKPEQVVALLSQRARHLTPGGRFVIELLGS